jgi:hypothetical protein
MPGTNGPKEPTLGVNVFTAPGKAMVGKRPKPFGQALCFDSIKSTLIFGEYDAALVDSMMRSLRPKLSQIGLLCTS